MSVSPLLGAVHADGIVSSDIVGYSTTDIVNGKLNMTGLSFVAVDGSDLDLNATSGEGLTAGDDDSNSDVVMVWNASTSGYEIYAYCDNGDGTATWYNMYGETEPVIPAGKGFWFKSYDTKTSGKTFVVSGAVEKDSDVTMTLVGGKLNMVVNPYPTAIDLNSTSSVVPINLTAGDDDSNSDVAMVWDASTSGYEIYAYCDNGDETATWYNMYGETEPVISAGKGFWFNATAGTGKALKFIRPY